LKHRVIFSEIIIDKYNKKIIKNIIMIIIINNMKYTKKYILTFLGFGRNFLGENVARRLFDLDNILIKFIGNIKYCEI
jgi:hypothetical protein